MTKLIEKNTTIPTRASEVFATAEDNQPAVTVHVLQGEREMAADNKSLGQFNLTDIKPGPRGSVQVEVTFDIDANGILNVSAKDKATGKEQSIKITASSGLTEDEINRMVKDAEQHASEDKQKRELVDARNQADALIHATKTSLQEHSDTLSDDVKSEVEKAIETLEDAVNGDDKALIDSKSKDLIGASAMIAESVSQEQTGQHESNASESGSSSDDDVVDAEFEDVSKDQK